MTERSEYNARVGLQHALALLSAGNTTTSKVNHTLTHSTAVLTNNFSSEEL